DRHLGRPRAAEDLESVIGAAVRDLAHLLHSALVVGVHRVGGAEGNGELEALIDYVHRDDCLRAGDLRSLDHIEADAAAADNNNGTTGRYLRVVEGGAETRGDGATDKGRVVEGEVVADGNAAALRHHGVLSEAADLAHVGNALPVPGRKARRAV